MNLIVDFGNTRVKVAVFRGTALIEKKTFDSEEDLLSHLKEFVGITNCLIASVTGSHTSLLALLNTRFPSVLFSSTTATPLTNLYKSLHTLGSDRLAGAVGSFTLYPHQNVLTIDAGTCIKYNFVNAKNEYLGGAISPGLSMRLKAMHEHTHGLPVIDMDKDYNTLIGENTRESMLSGALLGAAAEVEGAIRGYTLLYPDLQVVLTGGDSDYLCKQLKNRFFTDPTILLSGLNAILNFNIEL